MAPSEPKNNVTSAMQKLQHLSLINKVTKELDKNLGVNDKTLAEFIVDIAKASKFDPKTFFNELQKNGAELPEPFANELVGTIERLANKGGGGARGGEKKKVIVEKPTKENPFPGLHRPDAEEHAKMLSRELYGDRNPIENACDDPRLDKMNPGRLDENKNASSTMIPRLDRRKESQHQNRQNGRFKANRKSGRYTEVA
jgi:ATP-dependent RNA helicase DHX8/PRP22